MNVRTVVPWVRRRIPQTVRVRLALAYAVLFLAAGAALLGVTYGLVAGSLPNSRSPLTSAQVAKEVLACKAARTQQQQEQPGNPVPAPVPTSVGGKPGSAKELFAGPKPVPASCHKAFVAGANAATANQRDQTLHNLLLFSLLGLGAMTLVSGALGWVMAGRALRPVAAITGAARRASERHLGERLALSGPRDELKELADTFDAMLDRLDAAFASQQRFVADASHELRTPLTVMRTAIDVTLAKPSPSPEQLEAMAVKVRRSVLQAEKLIEALLTLATSERAESEGEVVDLATAAEDAVDAAEAAIARSGLRLDAEFGRAETRGDRVLLERLVSNLVDNAVRHNRRGGWIRLRTGADGAHCFVEVANSGAVVPEDEVASMFEPFRRMEGRTNGSDGVGLGLAIVKSIAAALGGRIEARGQAEGGLEISVVFVRAAGPPPAGTTGGPVSAPATTTSERR